MLRLLTALLVAFAPSRCLSWGRTYVDTKNKGVIVDTLRIRQEARDVVHDGPAPFLEADIVKAQQDRHQWSRDLEWHIENYSNYYDPAEVGA